MTVINNWGHTRPLKGRHERRVLPALTINLPRSAWCKAPWVVRFHLTRINHGKKTAAWRADLAVPGRPPLPVAAGVVTPEEVAAIHARTGGMGQVSDSLKNQVFAWGLGLPDHRKQQTGVFVRRCLVVKVEDGHRATREQAEEQNAPSGYTWACGFCPGPVRSADGFAFLFATGFTMADREAARAEARQAAVTYLEQNGPELTDNVTRRLGLEVVPHDLEKRMGPGRDIGIVDFSAPMGGGPAADRSERP